MCSFYLSNSAVYTRWNFWYNSLVPYKLYMLHFVYILYLISLLLIVLALYYLLSSQDLLLLEEQEGSVNFKFGVIYAKEGQTTDDEMLSNGIFFCFFVIY